jgi:deoxycytidine triphosphate deaminase
MLVTVLSDQDLLRMYPDSKPEPASIDLHIGDALTIWPDYVRRDPRFDQSALWKPVPLQIIDSSNQRVWTLKPGHRYLAATKEPLKILPEYAGEIGARSSWARDGLAVICGPAGWLDPGFEGHPTLELSVIGSELVLWPGARICQLILHQLSSPCLNPYRGKYQGNQQPTPSRSHLDVTP